MTLELIGIDKLTIDHQEGSPISGGTFTVTSIPSTKVKCENFGVFSGILAFTFSGGNGAGAVDGTVAGAGTISPTAVKVKSEGSLVIRKGDTGTLTATGTNASPPPPTLPFVGQVVITDVSQSTSKAQ